MDKKKVVIIGGGTVSWVRNHLAISAPAYGKTARMLGVICEQEMPTMETKVYLTKMADHTSNLETSDDISVLVDELISDHSVKMIFFSPSMVDFDMTIDSIDAGKDAVRLKSSDEMILGKLTVAEKVIQKIRKVRKDIFLVGFKQTHGSTEDEQYIEGLGLCKNSSCNLVLANDTKTRLNMVITPEEARYHVTSDRGDVLNGLVQMASLRSHLTFTRSTVISGDLISWESELVPDSLRSVINYCINEGAYKPFNGCTVGHFAVKVDDTTFLTSIRRSNFNDIGKNGLVKVKTDGVDDVIAYGARPSVGGQSQRIVFSEHEGMDCIVHFHSPIKEDSDVPQRSQYEFECGSHECGKNTSNGLKKFGNLKAVYLQEHGPNIVFNRNIDPDEVVKFIENNFQLEKKTGGYVST